MNVHERVTKGCLKTVLVLLSLLLLACQLTVDPAAQQKKQVAELLGKGQAALQKEQWIAPDNDNAVSYFRQVLALVPDQPQAQAGLQTVFDHYLDLARNAHNSGDFPQALAMVDQAELVLPPTALSQEMRAQIQEEQARVAAAKAKKLADALRERVEYTLKPIDSLNNRDEVIQKRIRDIAEHVRTIKATIRIDARTPTEAKWILEQMKHDEPTYNFHAEMHHSRVPKIVVMKPDT